MQQFVTDRRVDEEIGTITRFQADLDDILRHVMGFGKGAAILYNYTITNTPVLTNSILIVVHSNPGTWHTATFQ